MARLCVSTILLLLLVGLISFKSSIRSVAADQIQLSAILPKLQAIHQDAQTLLMKNSELKATILAGLQAQNELKLKLAKESKPNNPASGAQHSSPVAASTNNPISSNQPQPTSNVDSIDYAELEEFNKWVDVSLEYAVKNTQASMEALKEEAHASNGTVEYSEQAIKDGIEGVKYWQSAVIFQDKTLKNEKFEIAE